MNYKNMTPIQIVDHIRSEKRLELIKNIHKRMAQDRQEQNVDEVLDHFEECVEEPIQSYEYDPINEEIMEQVFG
jgi:hypothetical protein